MLPCVAVCCNVLQCVAVCCNMLQCAAVRCNLLQCVVGCCSVLHDIAVCCRMLQCVAVCCSVLQGVAECCSETQEEIDQLSRHTGQQDVAVCCSVFQCVAVCYSETEQLRRHTGGFRRGRKTQIQIPQNPKKKIAASKRNFRRIEKEFPQDPNSAGFKRILWKRPVQCGEDAWDALSCRSLFANEPLIIGLFCRK